MANLIFVYNGPVLDFSQQANCNKFGPCYAALNEINRSSPNNCFLLVNVSAAFAPYASDPDADNDEIVVVDFNAQPTRVDASPRREHVTARQQDVAAWIHAHSSGKIQIPIILIDLAELKNPNASVLLYMRIKS